MTTITIRTLDPETQRTALVANALFIQLRGATPAQIDAFLLANVTTLAQARPVLSMLAQAVAYLVNKESST